MADPVSLPTNFLRLGKFPIDSTLVVSNFNELTSYATNNPTAYTGQIVSVTALDAVYLIRNDKSVLPLQTGTLSGNWQNAYTIVNTNSSKWESNYNSWNNLSAGVIDVRNFNNNNSSTFIEVRSTVFSSSANWNSVYAYVNQTSSLEEYQNEVVSFVNINSSNIVNVNSKVNTTSANWDSVYSFVNFNSGKYDSVYSSWNVNSALDLAARTFVNSNSSNIVNVNTRVNTTSSNWNSVYSSWNSNSSLELNARSFVNSNSSNIVNVNTRVNQTSANWNSVYSSWNVNSGLDLNVRSFVNSNSSNIINVNTKVNTTSANWDSVYSNVNINSSLNLNVRTFVNSNSSNIVNVNTKINTTSANWDSVYSNVNINSSLDLNIRSFVNSNSSNIVNVNTRVNQTSANWNSVYSSWNVNSGLDLNVRSFVNSNSSNIVNVNTRVNQTSANWNSVYSSWNLLSSNLKDSQNFVAVNSSNQIQVNTWVNNNSGGGSLQLGSLSAKWESTFNTLCSLSGNWNLSYQYSTVYSNNSSKYVEKSFIENNFIQVSSVDTQLNINSTNVVQNSAVAKKIQDIENSLNILVDPPNYVQPTASIGALPSQVEIGFTINQNITLNWTQNNAGSPYYFRLTRNNALVNQQSSSWIYNVNETATSNLTTFTNTVSYEQGPILNNALGLPDERNRVSSGSKTASTSFRGFYRIFYGVVNVLPLNLRNLPKNNHFVTTNAGTVTNMTPSEFGVVDKNIIAIAMPSNRSLLEVVTQANENITNNFTLSTVVISDAAGSPVNYKLYRNTTIVPLNISLNSVKYL